MFVSTGISMSMLVCLGRYMGELVFCTEAKKSLMYVEGIKKDSASAHKGDYGHGQI